MKPKFLLIFSFLALGAACSSAPKENKLRIGFAMDTVREERWQRDKDAFEAQIGVRRQLKATC